MASPALSHESISKEKLPQEEGEEGVIDQVAGVESSLDLDVKAQEDIYEEGSIDPVYQAKAHVLNAAIQEIGMGRYQWYLFVVAGFGWFA